MTLYLRGFLAAQRHVQAASVPSGLQQAAGWAKARAACLDALADVYSAALELPRLVLPGLHDKLAADEVRERCGCFTRWQSGHMHTHNAHIAHSQCT
jgi:hypothetical protein